uniref:Mitochondrial resolvase Ydc2 catalytic domain-containing protein n=1 Tax=viral metagenome TaxID=1070528 RepID=A0A6C0BQA7_9ZZZZ
MLTEELWLGIDIGVRNLSYCVLRKSQDGLFIDAWQNLDLVTDHTDYQKFEQMNVMEMHALTDLVIPSLFPRSGCPYHHIVIEQQPYGQRGGSQKLGLFSHLIYRYFYNWFKNLGTDEKLISVRIQPAQSKYCKTWLDQYNFTKQKKYRNRKALSVALCQNLLRDHKVQELVERPGGNKQDDLADSFLLALYAVLFKPSFFTSLPPSSVPPQESPEPQGPQESPEPQESPVPLEMESGPERAKKRQAVQNSMEGP